MMQFPDYEQQVKQLVEQHKQLTDEPLILAIYYNVPQKPYDVFVFEIAAHFGLDLVATEKELFETEYASTEGFPVHAGYHLHLMLTNHLECQIAIDQGWPSIKPILDSIRRNEYRVIYKNKDLGGDQILHSLQNAKIAA